MKNLLFIFVSVILFSNLYGQDNETYSTLTLTKNMDQFRFQVPGENRYWFLSKTQIDNKAFALYSPDDGGWFTYWKANSGDMIVSKGRLGIGTTSPATKLETTGTIRVTSSTPVIHLNENDIADQNFQVDVSGGNFNIRTNNSTFTNASTKFSISSSGKVGIGTSTPKKTLDVNGSVRFGLSNASGIEISRFSSALADIPGSTGGIQFQGPVNSHVVFDIKGNDRNDGFYVRVPSTLQPDPTVDKMAFVVKADGKVGIGINPSEKLTVDGKIRSEEVQVVIIDGPDYVFEEDYELRSLEETKAYISKNKHLPEIPSAKQMEADGIELGDMNMRLLKKIEELTLYQIELMERLEKAEKEISKLKN
jgi:hypothetical protein